MRRNYRATARQKVTWQLFGPTLHVIRPCCGTPSRLRVVNDVPREVYDVPGCNRCGTRWTVTRTTLACGGARIDKLEWDTPHVGIHAINRKALLATEGN